MLVGVSTRTPPTPMRVVIGPTPMVSMTLSMTVVIVVIVALMIVELMIVVGMSCRKYIGAGDSSGIEL